MQPEPDEDGYVDRDAFDASFATGESDEFRWLSGVLVVRRLGAGEWAGLLHALSTAVEEIVLPQLRPEGRAAFELLWEDARGRSRRSKGLDWSKIPTDAVDVSVSGQVPPSTGVPSAPHGYVVFGETAATDYSRESGVILFGFGVVQGALLGGTASVEVQVQVVDWLQRYAGELAALGGWVSIDFTNGPQSVFERVCSVYADESDPRTSVYGFGPWTLLGPGQVAALGDVSALAALGQVDHLPGGYVLVGLGEDANTVEIARLRALQDALESVLPPRFRTVEEYFAQAGPEFKTMPYRI